jgi:hypothetical protein
MTTNGKMDIEVPCSAFYLMEWTQPHFQASSRTRLRW